jgi:hypothetical protein
VPADARLINIIGDIGGLGPDVADRPPAKITAAG